MKIVHIGLLLASSIICTKSEDHSINHEVGTPTENRGDYSANNSFAFQRSSGVMHITSSDTSTVSSNIIGDSTNIFFDESGPIVAAMQNNQEEDSSYYSTDPQAIERSAEGEPNAIVINPPSDYILKFTIEPKNVIETGSGYSSILHFTTGLYWSRLPGIWFYPGNTKLHVSISTLDSNKENHDPNPNLDLSLNNEHDVIITVVGSTAMVSVNGVISFKSVGMRAQVPEAQVYIGNPWYAAADAQISNISFEAATWINLAMPYGDYQDGGGELSFSDDGPTSILDADLSVTITGNVWKAFELVTPYSVNKRTKLRFALEIDEIAEGHAICIDEDTSADTFSGAKVRCVAIGGTQYKQWDFVMKIRDMPEAGQTENMAEYDINIAELFGYRDTTVKYLAIIQDNDTNPNRGRSIISSIALYDSDGDDTTLFRSTLSLTLLNPGDDVFTEYSIRDYCMNVPPQAPKAILLPSVSGRKCVEGYNFLEYECILAAQSVGGVLRNGAMVVGDWPYTPPGCFINPSDKGIHFSRNSVGMNDGRFSAICKPMVPQAILLPSVSGEQCVEEYNFFEYECISAAQSVGGVLRNGAMFMGDWSHTPPGCFINPRDNVIHFSRNSDGMNNGGYSAVCKPMPNIRMSPCAIGNENQRFRYEVVTEEIKIDSYPNLCLTLDESGDYRPDNIQLGECNNNDNQKWYSNNNEIKNRASTKCMDMELEPDEGNVFMHSCTDYWNQQFTLKDTDCECTVPNSECVGQPLFNDAPNRCKCQDGYINSNGENGDVFLESVDDTCVSDILSNTVHNGFTWDAGYNINNDDIGYNGLELVRRGEENDINIDLSNNGRKLQMDGSSLKFKGLPSGYLRKRRNYG